MTTQAKTMTMEEIKGLCWWSNTLKARSVWANLVDGSKLRIIKVNRTTLELMHGDGRVQKVYPNMIVSIDGL